MNGTFLKWAGGKTWFVEQAGALFPTNYNTYIEPFLGGGSVFFYMHPEKAIIADVNEELINTYKSVKTDIRGVYIDLLTHAENHSEEYYYMIRSQHPIAGSSEAAARMIYLNKSCFNGIYRVNANGEFNVPFGKRKRINISQEDLIHSSNILKSADIYCQNFKETISMAKKGDFLFCDPPYAVKDENDRFVGYTKETFTWDDQTQLAKALIKAAKKGVKVLITNAYHPSIVDLYPKESFKSVVINRDCRVAGSGSKSKKFDELITWTNFEFDYTKLNCVKI